MGVIPKPIWYESRLSAAHNIRLKLVRRVKQAGCYCLGYTKKGARKENFDGYYFETEIKRILTP